MSLVVNVFEKLRRETDGLVQFPEPDHDTDDIWLRSQQLTLECLSRLLNRDEREDLIRQLVHFLAACSRSGLIPLDALWDTPPYVSAFQKKLGGLDAASDDGLISTTTDGEPFTVYWTAMPGMSTCAQILFFTNGNVDFVKGQSLIDADPHSFTELERVMHLWADGFDRYRRELGGASQGDKRYRAVRGFLSEALGGEGYTCHQVGTQQVLDFWREHWHVRSLAMKTYKTNHDVLVDFVRAYASELQAYAVRGSSSVFDLPAETETDDFMQNHPTHSAWQQLASNKPLNVKLLKGTAWKLLDVVASVDPVAAGLRHSAVLVHSASELNNILGGADASTRAELYQQLGEYGFKQPYHELTSDAEDSLAGLETAVWASAHVLASNGVAEGVFLLAQLDERISNYLEQLAASFRDLDDTDLQARLVSEFYQAVGPSDAFPQQIDAPMKRSLENWQRMRLMGFKPADLERAEVLEELTYMAVDMPGALEQARAAIKFLAELSANSTQQKQDEQDMLKVFTQIYDGDFEAGVSHGQ